MESIIDMTGEGKSEKSVLITFLAGKMGGDPDDSY